MTNKEQVLDRILQSRVVAVIRSDEPDALINVVRALMVGGVTVAEITMTVPGAVDVIRQVSREFSGSELILGAGTVMTARMAEQAIEAGARFCVAPNFDGGMVRCCVEHQIAVCPGAFTPTEVQHAWQSGADLVKIFPASLGGPRYIKDLLGPLPDVKIMVTGGVDAETGPEFVKAGAMALGVGGALFNRQTIANRDWEQITANAREVMLSLNGTR